MIEHGAGRDVTFFDYGVNNSFARPFPDVVDFTQIDRLEVDFKTSPGNRAAATADTFAHLWYSLWLMPEFNAADGMIQHSGEIDIVESHRSHPSTGFAGCGDTWAEQWLTQFCRMQSRTELNPMDYAKHYTVIRVGEGTIEVRMCDHGAATCEYSDSQTASINLKAGYEQHNIFKYMWGSDDNKYRMRYRLVIDIWRTYNTGMSLEVKNLKFFKGDHETSADGTPL